MYKSTNEWCSIFRHVPIWLFCGTVWRCLILWLFPMTSRYLLLRDWFSISVVLVTHSGDIHIIQYSHTSGLELVKQEMILLTLTSSVHIHRLILIVFPYTVACNHRILHFNNFAVASFPASDFLCDILIHSTTPMLPHVTWILKQH